MRPGTLRRPRCSPSPDSWHGTACPHFDLPRVKGADGATPADTAASSSVGRELRVCCATSSYPFCYLTNRRSPVAGRSTTNGTAGKHGEVARRGFLASQNRTVALRDQKSTAALPTSSGPDGVSAASTLRPANATPPSDEVPDHGREPPFVPRLCRLPARWTCRTVHPGKRGDAPTSAGFVALDAVWQP